MNRINIFKIFSSVIIFIFILSFTVSAEEINIGFTNTSPVDIQEIKQSHEYNFKISSKENKSAIISGFDVSNNDEIAVLTEKNKINIYSSKGIFKYGVSFTSPLKGGSSIIYDKIDGNLVVELYKENQLIKIDQTGNIIAVESYGSSDNNKQTMNLSKIGNSFFSSKTKRGNKINCVLYDSGELRSLFLGEHSTVKIIRKDQHDIVVYDDNGKNAHCNQIFFISFFTFIIVGIIFMISYYKKHRKLPCKGKFN